MKIDIKKKYQYRNGKPARVLCVNAPGEYPVIAMRENGETTHHSKTGYFNDPFEHVLDLIEIREPRELWVIDNDLRRVYDAKQTDEDDNAIGNQVCYREVLPTTKPSPISSSLTEGWRELAPEENVEKGDEVNYGPKWVPAFGSIGNRVGDLQRLHFDTGFHARRRVTLPAATGGEDVLQKEEKFNTSLEIPEAPLQLEVGKYYLNRKGERVGPIVKNFRSDAWQFSSENTIFSYRQNGRMAYKEDRDSLQDLISLAPDEEPANREEFRVQPEEKIHTTLETLKNVFAEKLAAMSDEEIVAKFREIGCEVVVNKPEDSAPQTDLSVGNEPQASYPPPESEWPEKPEPGVGMVWERQGKSGIYAETDHVIRLLSAGDGYRWVRNQSGGTWDGTVVFYAIPAPVTEDPEEARAKAALEEKPIQRWDGSVYKSDTGEWVRYSDHLAAIEALSGEGGEQ